MNDITTGNGDIMEQVIIKGDLAKLTPQERVLYYKAVCASGGFNPLTKPFEFINLNGKMVLYALKGATDQLRELRGVSVEEIQTTRQDDMIIVSAKVRDKAGRTDADVGAVYVGGLKGEALANAMMKAQTKAKRRATLSICGLGMLDETEVETVPNAQPVHIDHDTGEITNGTKPVELPPAARDIARRGMAALDAWWKEIGREGRIAIGAQGLASLKAIAAEVKAPAEEQKSEAPDIEFVQSYEGNA